MSDLTTTTPDQVVAACQANAADAAEALTRALDGAFALQAPKSPAPAAQAPDGPGLLVMLTVDGAGLAIALPESGGMLPAWYAAPDATGESKLTTLAQELSMLLVPETLGVDKFEARRVESLAAALRSAGAAPESSLVSLAATKGATAGEISIVWPLGAPGAAWGAPAPEKPPVAAPQPAAEAPRPASSPARGPAAPRTAPASIGALPHYARSLLKITLPVSVQLASKKESIQEVVEIVPGAIIKFEKGCDELLQMVIGGQCVAEGEAVKIGDKFGFRVTGMLLPREHFIRAARPRAS